jgi:hypothetical protein
MMGALGHVPGQGKDPDCGARRYNVGTGMRNEFIVAAAAIALRLWLIFSFPVIYGGDSMLRLINRDHILFSYQLPLLQALIWTVSRASSSVLPVRLLMVALSAFAAVAFYRLASDFAGPRAALGGGLLFATNPFITWVSSVPYQEILLVACLLMALHSFFQKHDAPASLWLGLACLTRFEAWVACPILVWAAWHRGRAMWQSALLYAWAPLLWVAFRRGLSEPGTFVLDRAFSFDRLYRLPFLAGHTLANATAATLALAAIGVYVIIRERRERDPRLRILAALLGLFAVAILFSAHGEPPDTNRYVTTREIHIPLVLVTLLAAIGCARFPRLAIPLVAMGVALGAAGARRLVVRETSRPEIRLGYELAHYLDDRMRPGETVMILSPPLEYGLYLRRLRETGGEKAVQAAQQVLAEVDTSPLDLQRTRVHSRFPWSQFVTYPRDKVDWIAVWSTYVPQDERAARLAEEVRAHPDRVLTVGAASVHVRHTR